VSPSAPSAPVGGTWTSCFARFLLRSPSRKGCRPPPVAARLRPARSYTEPPAASAAILR
jgi:hypothetical protein